MASNAVKTFIKSNHAFKRGAEIARQEIFGHVPQLNVRSGSRAAKKQFTGNYLAKYYPESINKYARMVSFGDAMRLEDLILIKFNGNETSPRSMKIGRRKKKNTGE